MTTIILILITIFVLFVSLQLYFVRRSKKMKGKQLNVGDFPNRFNSIILNGKNLFYFYSPNCSACKVQAPIIEKLKSELKNIYSIDISKDLNLARTFGIMGTPSVVVVNKGKIEDYFIGVQKEETLKSAYYKNL